MLASQQLVSPSQQNATTSQISEEQIPDLQLLLTMHQIEPELLGPRPRWIKHFRHRILPSNSLAVQIALPILFLIVMSLLLEGGFFSWRQLIFLLPIGILLSTNLKGLYEVARIRKKRYRLLREGIAVPAVLTSWTEIRGMVHLGVLYDTGAVDYHKAVITFPARLWPRQNGTTLTLLVSPEDEKEIHPYFLMNQSVIVPVTATNISRSVAAKILAQSSVPIDPLNAIEPELLGATPRRVRLSKKGWLLANTIFLMIAIPITLITIACRFVGDDEIVANIVMGGITVCAFSSLIIYVLGIDYWLRAGKVARATIIKATSPLISTIDTQGTELISFTYEFETSTGKITNSLVVRRQKAWQYDLKKGSTFTVLYHSPELVKPYFQIDKFEIVGAMGARISSPP